MVPIAAAGHSTLPKASAAVQNRRTAGGKPILRSATARKSVV